jgi:hypothetical protein
VDSKTIFSDTFAGFLGSVHDSCILSRSHHKLIVTNDKKIANNLQKIEGIHFYKFIIDGAGYTASWNMYIPRSGQQ